MRPHPNFLDRSRAAREMLFDIRNALDPEDALVGNGQEILFRQREFEEGTVGFVDLVGSKASVNLKHMSFSGRRRRRSYAHCGRP
jgi:hypothetical protein